MLYAGVEPTLTKSKFHHNRAVSFYLSYILKEPKNNALKEEDDTYQIAPGGIEPTILTLKGSYPVLLEEGAIFLSLSINIIIKIF